MKCINVNEIENEDNDKTMMESLADKEYELCLKNALREALDENEKVRNYFLNKIYNLDEGAKKVINHLHNKYIKIKDNHKIIF